jgi:hypothetical protein
MAATFELKAGAAFAGGPFSLVGTMTLFKKISDHLTVKPHDRTARMSHPGQFGGTGPALKTCRGCRNWGEGKADHHSGTGKYHGHQARLLREVQSADARGRRQSSGRLTWSP